MKMFHLILLSFSLILVSCKDDKAIRRHRDLSFLLGLFEMGFFKPNYCSPPQLLLEEGKTYNITLEAGRRFWFDYGFRSQGDNRNHRLTINKNNSDEIGYQIKDCGISNDLGERKIVSSNPNQIIYESESFGYTSNSNSNATSTGFFLESKIRNATISISFIKI
jgi:hypothetical protein